MIDTILQGDCKEVLKQFEDNYFDAICTDPPYELAFMGKKWDASGIAYDINVWRECLRVLKPGGHMLAFGGTRTYHRMASAIEDAGFEIRDTISWTFGSGFPKSLSIDKAIDKYFKADREIIGENPNARPNSQTAYSLDGENANFRATYQPITAPSTPAAKQWSGFGTALKPAHEMICLARKPLACKTIAENVLAYGCGGLNIDASRVDSGQPRATGTKHQNKPAAPNDVYGKYNSLTNQLDYDANLPTGRFPSNLIWSHSPLCKQIGETWDCHPSCPTWEFKKGRQTTHADKRTCKIQRTPLNDGSGAIYGKDTNLDPQPCYGDTGSPARFFKSCSYTPDDIDAISPFAYFAKASRAERERGLDGMPDRIRDGNNGIDRGIGICTGCGLTFNGSNDHSRCVGERIDTPLHAAKNNHPTIKPLQLISYLARLICPPGGTILDPFGGSGTTAVSAIREGFHYVLIEKEPAYIEIAKARAAHEQAIANKRLASIAHDANNRYIQTA